jgi:hypothetical protein
MTFLAAICPEYRNEGIVPELAFSGCRKKVSRLQLIFLQVSREE